MRDLTGQVAVVTGASSGIGKAIALSIARQGGHLCLVGRQPETLDAVAQSARASSPQVLCYQSDLTLDSDIQHLVASIRKDVEGVDILIHSAGVIELGPMDTASVEHLDRQYRINLRAPYVLTQELLPTLRSREGQVVFINSTVGLNAKAGVGQYAASKHALKALSDTLREEVNSSGIRVLSVFLGRTASPMQENVHRMEQRPYAPDHLLQPDDVAAMIISALTLPRRAEVTEIRIRPMRKSY